MLDRQLIRRDPEGVRRALLRKGSRGLVDAFLDVDSRWRETRAQLDSLNAEANKVSKSIGQLMAQGRREEAESAKVQTRELKSQVQAAETRERELESELLRIELSFPNLPHPSVPDGEDEAQNVVVRTWGEPPTGPTEPHYDLAARLGIIDFERGAKVAGSGYIVYRGLGARLQRVLADVLMAVHAANGYEEILPPVVANAESLVGTGNLPKFEEDLYSLGEGLYLIPTAEVPVTNLYRDEILDFEQLPMRMAAVSSCFRREAGAAGRLTRGIQRIHQFEKVELVKLTAPESSYDELESLTRDAESVLQLLGLHYRVLELCAGDLGDKGAKCYDLEVWSPAEGRFLEVSSCTNFEAFQARRANLRFRRAPGERPEFVHTLNGSGTALPRLTIAILEAGLQEDGSVLLPEALRPAMKTDRIPSS